MRLVRSVKTAFSIVSAALIAGGMGLLVWPETSATVICTALGVASVIYGAVRLIGYFSNDLYRLAFQFDLAAGILAILIGLALLIRTDLVLTNLPFVAGIFLLGDSLLRLQTAVDARHFGLRRWWTVLLAAIPGTAAGTLLLLRPLTGGRLLMRHLGLALILEGAQNLLLCFYTIRVPRRAGADVIDTTCTSAGNPNYDALR